MLCLNTSVASYLLFLNLMNNCCLFYGCMLGILQNWMSFLYNVPYLALCIHHNARQHLCHNIIIQYFIYACKIAKIPSSQIRLSQFSVILLLNGQNDKLPVVKREQSQSFIHICLCSKSTCCDIKGVTNYMGINVKLNLCKSLFLCK